jgi:hypothetical protein
MYSPVSRFFAVLLTAVPGGKIRGGFLPGVFLRKKSTPSFKTAGMLGVCNT